MICRTNQAELSYPVIHVIPTLPDIHLSHVCSRCQTHPASPTASTGALQSRCAKDSRPQLPQRSHISSSGWGCCGPRLAAISVVCTFGALYLVFVGKIWLHHIHHLTKRNRDALIFEGTPEGYEGDASREYHQPADTSLPIRQQKFGNGEERPPIGGQRCGVSGTNEIRIPGFVMNYPPVRDQFRLTIIRGTEAGIAGVLDQLCGN
jgi:hypothetical protein